VFRTALRGTHQAQNAAIALAAAEAFLSREIETESASKALSSVSLPGRFQIHGKYIFDVAHNPDGASVLAETLALVSPPYPRTALFSVLGDKSWPQMMTALAPQVDHFILSTAPSAPEERRWNLDSALQFAQKSGIDAEAEPDFDAAVGRVKELPGTVIVTGSFHTVGDAMLRLHVAPGPE
jgi:dihydrofolate synthase/folylpolyglutamate synthase